MAYVVHTIFLSRFREAALKVAEQRHNPSSAQELANAMKRLELADKVLEEELNRFVEQGYELVSALDLSEETAQDLIFTAIFRETTETEPD